MRCAVRDKTPDDGAWIEVFVRAEWGGSIIVNRGGRHNLLELPGLIAERGGERCGLLTYRIEPDGWQITTLNAVPPHHGAGTQLIDALARRASQAGCRRLWLITTNDNIDALRFYQRRGFALVAVHPRAVEEARKLKPTIPPFGNYGIAIRDEIVLERRL